jgi:hypothetical protein
MLLIAAVRCVCVKERGREGERGERERRGERARKRGRERGRDREKERETARVCAMERANMRACVSEMDKNV